MVDTQAAADFVCNKSKSRACSFHSILSIRIMMNDFLYICKAYSFLFFSQNVLAIDITQTF